MSGDTEAEFAIKLKDETSGPSADAARALEQLKKKIAADTKALSEMQRAMRNLKGSGAVGANAMRQLKDRISAQKASIAQSQAKFIELGGTFGDVAGKAGALGTSLGPIGAALGTVATALLAIAAAAGVAIAALVRYGIAQADVRRAELLHLEGLTTIRRYYGLAAGSATELQRAIDQVSDSSALGRSQIASYTEQLYRMGLRGDALRTALEGMSIVGSVQGERMAQRFAGMAAGAVRTGRSIRAMTDDVRARLGGIADRQALSLNRQIERLHENFSRLFDGLRIEGLLRALHTITSLFSQSTASGRALKAMLEALFNPLLDSIETLAPLARRFFQGMVLALQEVTIVALELAVQFRRTFGGRSLLGNIDAMSLALAAGKAVIYTVVTALVVAAAIIAVVVAAAAALTAGVSAATAAIVGLIAGAVALYDWITTNGARLGSSLVEGLIAGIRGGVDRVAATVRTLGTVARVALEQALQIHSPSRVFARLGVQIPRGLAEGVDAGTPAAEGAVERMGDAAAGAGGGTSSRSSTSISIGAIYVQTASEQPEEQARSIVDELARLLEGVAIQIGAPA